MVNGVCVSSGFASAFGCSCISVSGRPEDRTQRGSVISRTWATSPRRPLLSRAPRGRTENLLVPNQACSQLHLCPMLSFHSVRTVGFEPTISSSPNWRDNQTSLRSDDVSSPYGNRTHLSALKERYPAPIDERAVLCRCVRVPFTQWTGRRSNPRLLLFRQALDRLSYQSVSLFGCVHEKSPMSL